MVIPKDRKSGSSNSICENHEKHIRKYLTDGAMEISNNRGERAVKAFVMVRNYVYHIF